MSKKETKALSPDGLTRVLSSDGSSDDDQGFKVHSSDELAGRKVKGLTVYRGVVLLTEKAPEANLLLMIDELMPAYRGRLVMVGKDGPMLSMVWRGFIPQDLGVSAEMRVPKGTKDAESWTVERATQVA